jgi:polar amino acid transport system substrate-binding protein
MKHLWVVAVSLFMGIMPLGAKAQESKSSFEKHAQILTKKDVLRNGWYPFEPYQYVLEGENELVALSGLDVQLTKAVAQEMGKEVSYEQIGWRQHQEDLKMGIRDMASGAIYTDERKEYAYFSEPYRFEENVLFMLKKPFVPLSFSTLKDLLTKIQTTHFRLGVVDGFMYADPELNAFIENPKNKDFIVRLQDNAQSLQKLLKGEIDGFLADRLVGSTLVWKSGNGSQIKEYPLNVKAPIRFMFSKKTVSLETVQAANKAIQSLKTSGRYNQILSWYLQPVMLLQTLDSQWFFVIEILGTIAFAISGLVVAYKEKSTLFGAFIFAVLPALGGGIVRDTIVGRRPIGAMASPIYLYFVIGTVLIGFLFIKVIGRKYLEDHSKAQTMHVLNTIFSISDALGLAAFTVIGVVVAILAKLDPLWVWGPFLAFLTGAGGGMLRDLITKEGQVSCLYGQFYPEIAIGWGALLSVFLTLDASEVNPERIFYGVMATVVGAFFTRLWVYYSRIPNVRF